jgi:hypothetical protein
VETDQFRQAHVQDGSSILGLVLAKAVHGIQPRRGVSIRAVISAARGQVGYNPAHAAA